MDRSAAKVGILHYQSYPDIRVAKFARSLTAAGCSVTVLARDLALDNDPRGKHPYPVGGGAAEPAPELRAVTPPGTARGRWRYMPYHVNPYWRAGIRRLLDEGCRLLVVRDLHLVPAATALARSRRVPVLFDMAENYPAVLHTWRRHEGRRRAVVNGVVRNIALARWVERRGVRDADAVTVVVPEHLPRVRSLAAGRAVDVTVVENTPVLEELLGLAVTPSRPGGRALEVLYTGEIHTYRGIDTVIDAARLIAARGAPDVRFRLVGTGKLLPELQRRAAAAGVAEQVEFAGWQPDLRPFLAAADVAIVPPHRSAHYDVTMPNKLYDAMAFGLPVVVSDTPPMRRVVTQSQCGLVFASGDPGSLAAAIEQLADPDLRKRLGRNGRAAVESRYRWDVDAAVLVELVDRLLDRPPQRSPAPTMGRARTGSDR